MTVRHRAAVLGIASAIAIAASGTAYAFDCIRVSSSSKGVQQSAKSGNWLPFDFGSAAGVSRTFADVFEFPLSDEQAACIATKYAATGQPKYFALGIGVAGASGSGEFREGRTGVLAWNNKNYKVLSDGRGIDHIENAVLGAVFESAGKCGLPIGEA